MWSQTSLAQALPILVWGKNANMRPQTSPATTSLTHLYALKTHTTDRGSYGKPAPGAESHYEFCCSFPQNAHTLHALESLIFTGHLC